MPVATLELARPVQKIIDAPQGFDGSSAPVRSTRRDPNEMRRANLNWVATLTGVGEPVSKREPINSKLTEQLREPESRIPFADLKLKPASEAADVLIHKGLRINGIRKDVLSDTSAIVRVADMATVTVNTENESELVLPNGNPRHVETKYSLEDTVIATTTDQTTVEFPTYINDRGTYLADTSIGIRSDGITKTVSYTPAEGSFNVLPHLTDGPLPESVFVLPTSADGQPSNYTLIGAVRNNTKDGVRYILPATDNLTSSTVITFDMTTEGVVQITRIMPIGKISADPDVQTARRLQADPDVQAQFAELRRRELLVTKEKKAAAELKAKMLKQQEQSWKKAVETTPAKREKLAKIFGRSDSTVDTMQTLKLHSPVVNELLATDLAKDQEAAAVTELAVKLALVSDNEQTRSVNDIFVLPSALQLEPQTKPEGLSKSMEDRIARINSDFSRTSDLPRTRRLNF